MRVISGIWKGRIFKAPKGIRPTSDKVKEAIFDILGRNINGKSVLDLFSGSGSLGFEAISRGAASVVFVDNNKGCIRIIRENLSKLIETRLQITEKQKNIKQWTIDYGLWNTSVLHLDVFKAIHLFHRKGKKFDIILLDPPYYKDVVRKVLINFLSYDILSRNGLIIAEHYKKDVLPNTVERLKLIRQSQYGDTMVSFFGEIG